MHTHAQGQQVTASRPAPLGSRHVQGARSPRSGGPVDGPATARLGHRFYSIHVAASPQVSRQSEDEERGGPFDRAANALRNAVPEGARPAYDVTTNWGTGAAMSLPAERANAPAPVRVPSGPLRDRVGPPTLAELEPGSLAGRNPVAEALGEHLAPINAALAPVSLVQGLQQAANGVREARRPLGDTGRAALDIAAGGAGALSGAAGTLSLGGTLVEGMGGLALGLGAESAGATLGTVGAAVAGSGALATTAAVGGSLAGGIAIGDRGQGFAREHDLLGRGRDWSDLAADLGGSVERRLGGGTGAVAGRLTTGLACIGLTPAAAATGVAGLGTDVYNAARTPFGADVSDLVAEDEAQRRASGQAAVPTPAADATEARRLQAARERVAARQQARQREAAAAAETRQRELAASGRTEAMNVNPVTDAQHPVAAGRPYTTQPLLSVPQGTGGSLGVDANGNIVLRRLDQL